MSSRNPDAAKVGREADIPATMGNPRDEGHGLTNQSGPRPSAAYTPSETLDEFTDLSHDRETISGG